LGICGFRLWVELLRPSMAARFDCPEFEEFSRDFKMLKTTGVQKIDNEGTSLKRKNMANPIAAKAIQATCKVTKEATDRHRQMKGDCKKHIYYFVTPCMLIYFLAITFVFWLQMTQDS